MLTLLGQAGTVTITKNKIGPIMKINYRLRPVTREERIINEYLLLDEMDSQKWYQVVFLKIWRGSGLVMLQQYKWGCRINAATPFFIDFCANFSIIILCPQTRRLWREIQLTSR